MIDKLPSFTVWVAFVVLGCSGIAAQSSLDKCPIIIVTGPSESVWTGTPITFTARLAVFNPTAKPEFNWTISAGEITVGQGTSTITVGTNELEFVPVTATVEVSGITTSCPTRASYTTEVINCGLPIPVKFDQYDLSVENENVRLDNFAVQLTDNPGAHALIFGYSSQKVGASVVDSRLKRAKNYLVKRLGCDPERIVTQNAGPRKEPKIELFLVPSGATDPGPETTPR